MLGDEAVAFSPPVLWGVVFIFAGFLLWKVGIFPVPSTAAPGAMQLVLYCQDSMHCSSRARYGSEESHKRHPWSYLKNKESLYKARLLTLLAFLRRAVNASRGTTDGRVA